MLQSINITAENGNPRALEFNVGAFCITDLFLQCLGRVELAQVKKIIVQARDPLTKSNTTSAKILDDVAIVDASFDFELYWQGDEISRKHLLVDTLSQAVGSAAATFGWSPVPFDKARQCAIEKRLENARLWRRRVRSPSGVIWAQVFYTINQREMIGYILFTNRKGIELQRSEIFNLIPSDFELYLALGRLEWVSERVVVLFGRHRGERREAVFRPV